MGVLSFLPRYSRVETWYAIPTIGVFTRKIQLPHGLRIIRMCHLHNLRSRLAEWLGHIEFDVPIWQRLNTTAPEGIKTWKILPEQVRGLGVFVHLEDSSPAI